MNPTLWREWMYEGAKGFWPDLTPRQFAEAAQAWIAEQPKGATLTVEQVTIGLKAELTARHGPPARNQP